MCSLQVGIPNLRKYLAIKITGSIRTSYSFLIALTRFSSWAFFPASFFCSFWCHGMVMEKTEEREAYQMYLYSIIKEIFLFFIFVADIF